MTVEEINEAFKEALFGNDTPDLIVGICNECKSQIILTKEKQQYCIHFEKYIKELANG